MIVKLAWRSGTDPESPAKSEMALKVTKSRLPYILTSPLFHLGFERVAKDS